jgi:predicted ATPase/DNA-binding CsgD family transcriptional regulator
VLLVEPPHSLPAPRTSFVGREREIDEVTRLLEGTRLMTLVGSPGVGKTRLAIEIAYGLLDTYEAGAWLIELAPIDDAAMVPHAVAAAVGVREQALRPLPATLATAVGARHMLLVLDNCEHLVAACAELTDALLNACPNLRVLATSREPLRVIGETIWRVPSLSFPPDVLPPGAGDTVAALMTYESVRLFMARAEGMQPRVNLNVPAVASAVAGICRQLDGIPLALELAAARVAALGVEQLAERLDDQFRVLVAGSRAALPRQQTLRALVDWGYALLSDPERILLRRLSVFSGGWSVAAAEGVCAGDGLDPGEILPLLMQLVDKSQVVADGSDGHIRYRLLQTLRHYGAERLQEAGEVSTLRTRHLEWFAELAESAEEALWGSDQEVWFERLRVESNNIRAAMEWSVLAVSHPSLREAVIDAGLRLGGALWHFWNLDGHLSEGRAQLLRLLRTGVGSPAVRARGFYTAGYRTYMRGDPASGATLVNEALSRRRDFDFPFKIASALLGQALAELMAGDADRASALAEEGLLVSRRAGDRRGMYFSQYGLAEVARVRGDFARAVALMDEAHALTVEQNDPWSIAFASSILANLNLLRGDVDRAFELQQESLRLRHAIRDPLGIARSLDGLAWVASDRAQPTRAARLFGAADGLRERTGAAPHPPWRVEHERYVAATRAQLGNEAFTAAWTAGRAQPLEDMIAFALEAGALTAPPAVVVASEELSRREREVALLIARGHTNREIASSLVISEWTVDTHVRHILNKLHMRSRAQVAAWAVERGLSA